MSNIILINNQIAQMKKTSFFLILFISFIGLLSSCKKDDATVTPSKSAMLTAKTWQVNTASIKSMGITIDYTKGGTNPLYDLNKVRMTFKTDGTWTGLDIDGKTSNGTWVLTTNDTKIELKDATGKGNTFGVDSVVADITTLSTNNFDINFSATTTTGTGTVTIKFIPA
jgi:hypothetical protein